MYEHLEVDGHVVPGLVSQKEARSKGKHKYLGEYIKELETGLKRSIEG